MIRRKTNSGVTFLKGCAFLLVSVATMGLGWSILLPPMPQGQRPPSPRFRPRPQTTPTLSLRLTPSPRSRGSRSRSASRSLAPGWAMWSGE